jgi:hypothetical protein
VTAAAESEHDCRELPKHAGADSIGASLHEP